MFLYRLKSGNQRHKGFTLSEVLIAVGIVVILLAIGIPSLIHVQRNLRQEELDTKAETIYQAAQNRLSEMNLSGSSSAFQNDVADVTQLSYVPDDAGADDGIEAGDISYITSEYLTTSGSAASAVMNGDIVDEELLNNHWVIEYNPETSIVYAVFYSETKANCATEYPGSSLYDVQLRYKDNRLSNGAKVGYYGGGSGTASSTVTDMQPSLTVVNEEKLMANATCTVPTSVSDYPVFKVELSDSNGHTYTVYYAYYACSSEYMTKIKAEAGSNDVISTADAMKKTGRTYSVNITLDDLSSEATRFVNLYGAGSSHFTKLDAGTPLTITVTTMCPGNYKVSQNLSDSKVTNSLFDDVSTADTAEIRYGRHLQNLDQDSGVSAEVTAAEQVSDIKFAENDDTTGTKNWYETYSDDYYNGCSDSNPVFEPITNPNLLSYDGAPSEQYRIADLCVRTDVNAGLFGTAGNSSNETIRNVVLTGADVSTTGSASYAGGLIGEIDGNVSIDHCQVYLTSSDISGKTNKDVWISGTTAGGLVGHVSDGTVTIEDSGASTVVGAYTFNNSSAKVTEYKSTDVGGLIGSVSGGAVSITGSYADCYLVGKNASGLVGTSTGTVSLNACYSAGFVTFSGEGAGLVLGSADMENSYTIMCKQYMDGTDDTDYYGTAKSGSVSGNVYYSIRTNLQSDAAEPALDDDTQGIDGASISELADALGTDHFKSDTSDSTAYNLMGQSLTAYTYPELTGVVHYGDWNADFQVGALVYYEKYKNNTYGFYGANVDSTLKSDVDVTGDGYGFAFLKGSKLPDTTTANITFKDGTTQSYVLTLSTITPYEVTGEDGKTYEIYPLDLSLVNTSNPSSDYYLKVEVEGDGASGNEYYYFNPHFAKTVVYLTNKDAKAPTFTKDSEIYIRTPRQLYLMSQYYSVYRDITQPASFVQERNIDYATYEWSTFYDEGTASVKNQNPIGRSDDADTDVSFAATFDGKCNWIRNISFVSTKGSYIGLFGENEGTIKNVVLRATYDPDSSSNYYAARTGDISNNITVCIGMIAGKNSSSGKISNSAVSGYYLAGSDGTIHAYQNTTLYAGGLAGLNEGSITNSSADMPKLILSTVYANVYAGGFAGYNSGTISDAYALGSIQVVYAKGGTVAISGFAGKNSGAIKNSYCATALTASGDGTSSYGFASGSGSASGCYYLNNGTYSYIDTMYPFNFEGGTGTAKSYSELLTLASGTKAAVSYDFNNTETASKSYPFRAVVKNASGQLVHYGDWIDDETIGSVGIFYWELEEQGSNNGYHFTYIGTDADGNSFAGTTLCTSHDDGGIITKYGYGYFVLNQDAVQSISLTGALINGSATWNYSDSALYDKTASEALQKQMHVVDDDGTESDFYFYAFQTRTSGQAELDSTNTNYLCMNTGNSGSYSGTWDALKAYANSTWKLTYKMNTGATQTYSYTISPFFANAMSASGAKTITETDGTKLNLSQDPGQSTHPYEVRSIAQLQFINWSTNLKAYTDTGTEGTEKYFPYECYTSGATKYYSQNHDIKNTTDSTGASTKFYPLGRAGRSFKETYDGHAYQIRNLYIDESTSSYVGLFGEIGGEALLKNMALTADAGKGIIRSTYYANSTNNSSNNYREPAIGAYGGLIWLGGSNTGKAVMTNCSASGYEIIYAGTVVKGFYRYITMGGLVGSIFSGTIENCTAANTIEMLGTSNDIRQHLGGLVGSAGNSSGASSGSTITNCYSGGKIETNNTTNLLSGGLVGNGKAHDRNTGNCSYATTLSNCYTYCSVLSSTVSGMTGYHYLYGNTADLSNCYFLKRTTADADSSIETDCALTFTEMSDGTLLSKLGGASGTGGISYDTGVPYHNVTTTEGSGNVRIDGKYSYPVSSSLDGKNYPFPAIIVQKDLTFSTAANPIYVYVHYGDWTISGPYFENGQDSMDIFTDMNDSGDYKDYATKEFRLYLNGTTMAAPTVDSFTSDDETIAAVVAVGEKAKDDDGLEYYPVTVEAQSIGNAVISLKDTTASFTVEITANITALAETDPSPFKLSENKTGTITFRAVTATNEDGTIPDDAIHYEANSNTTWQIEKNETFTLTQTTNKNIWKVTRECMGYADLTCTFTYDYHGTDITANVYVPVYEPDNVGLSDGKVYNVAELGDSDQTGADTTYIENAPSAGSGDLFLYLTNSDSGIDWYTMTIESVSVDGTTAEKSDVDGKPVYKTSGTDSYELVMNSTATSDSSYQYLSGSISCFTTSDITGNKKNVPLTVVLSDANGVKYTLSITLAEVETTKALTITYKDQAGNSADVAILSGEHKLPAEEEIKAVFTNQGKTFTIPKQHVFKGWTLEGDSSGKVYTAGENYEFTEDVVFTAAFDEVLYSVTLDANGGAFGGTLTTATLMQSAIAESIDISAYYSGALKAVKTGYTLTGWNTSANGTGTALTDNEMISADELDQLYTAGTMTLYAQWEVITTNIVLEPKKDGNSTQEFTIDYGASALVSANTYVKPSAEGFSFTGWYTAENDGVMVVDTDGKLVKNVADYTDANGKWLGCTVGETVTLYGHWKETSHNLTLVSGNAYSETFTIKEGAYIVYPTPGDNGDLTLDGWYTSNDGTGTKVLNADGTIAAATLSGYTSGGYFALTQDQTLYARWAMSVTRYVLTTGNFSEGTYLIVNQNTVGSAYSLSMDSRGNISATTVMVSDDGTKKYIEDSSSLCPFEITRYSGSKYHLHANGLYLTCAGTYLYSIDSKTYTHAWTIQTNSPNTIYYQGNRSSYYLNYSGDEFELSTSSKNVYLYEKTTDTTYTFVHEDETGSEVPVESHILTLKNGNTAYGVYYATNGTSVLWGNTYTAPVPSDSSWTLDGWYTKADGSGVKILNADGTIANWNVSGYTDAAGYALSGDTTLYACWSKSGAAYTRTTALTAGQDYVILAQNSAGETYAFGQDASGQKSESGFALTESFDTVVSQNLLWNIQSSGAIYSSGASAAIALDETEGSVYGYTTSAGTTPATSWHYDSAVSQLSVTDSNGAVKYLVLRQMDDGSWKFVISDEPGSVYLYVKTIGTQTSFESH